MTRARVIAIVHRHAAPRHATPSRVVRDLQRWWHALVNHLLDPYRPERHYMRGPGPKWREKHRR
ncbi:MAG: hypothetical protein ACJ8F2_03725 [Xanthobacteraceae bacterium]